MDFISLIFSSGTVGERGAWGHGPSSWILFLVGGGGGGGGGCLGVFVKLAPAPPGQPGGRGLFNYTLSQQGFK